MSTLQVANLHFEATGNTRIQYYGNNIISVSSSNVIFQTSTYTNGTITAESFNALSDLTYKTNIEGIDNPVNTLYNIRGVSFNWKKDNSPSYGVIAQDVESVLPDLVSKNPDQKTVNYNGLLAVVVEAIKELSDKVKNIETRLNNM